MRWRKFCFGQYRVHRDAAVLRVAGQTGLSALLRLPLPQPDAGGAAVLVNELHACAALALHLNCGERCNIAYGTSQS